MTVWLWQLPPAPCTVQLALLFTKEQEETLLAIGRTSRSAWLIAFGRTLQRGRQKYINYKMRGARHKHYKM